MLNEKKSIQIKKIVFLTQATYEKQLTLFKNQMQKNMAEERIQLCFCQAASVTGQLEREQKGHPAALYVTDTQQILHLLLEREFYVAALYHAWNKGEDLSEASFAIEQPEELTASDWQQIFDRLAGQPWQILSTTRLLVRETTEADVKAFYEIYQEPSITYYMENLYEDPDQEIAYTREYIDNVYGFYGYGMWTVIGKKTGQIIGRAGLGNREGYDIPELGFVIRKEEQRKGYAYEVCAEILEYGRKRLAFRQIQALAEPGNLPSRRLLQKLGFQEQALVSEQRKEYCRYLWTI